MRLTVRFCVVVMAVVASVGGVLISRTDASIGTIPLKCDRACLENVVSQWFKSIPPAQRMSRQELISIADGYFTGLQKNDGKGINGTGTYPFTEDCHRIENGSPTTNVPRPQNEAPGTINANAMDCLAQFKLGYYFIVQAIHGRRYPVVDTERGIVWAHAVFDQGTVNSGVLSDGRPYSFGRGLFTRPSSILVTEAFLIENGKIRRVEMVGPGVTYHMNSPWPGGLSGN